MPYIFDLPREVRDKIWEFCLTHSHSAPDVTKESSLSVPTSPITHPQSLSSPLHLSRCASRFWLQLWVPAGVENAPALLSVVWFRSEKACYVGLLQSCKAIKREIEDAITRMIKKPGGFPCKLDVLITASGHIDIAQTSCLWNPAVMTTLEVSMRHRGFLDSEGHSLITDPEERNSIRVRLSQQLRELGMLGSYLSRSSLRGVTLGQAMEQRGLEKLSEAYGAATRDLIREHAVLLRTVQNFADFTLRVETASLVEDLRAHIAAHPSSFKTHGDTVQFINGGCVDLDGFTFRLIPGFYHVRWCEFAFIDYFRSQPGDSWVLDCGKSRIRWVNLAEDHPMYTEGRFRLGHGVLQFLPSDRFAPLNSS